MQANALSDMCLVSTPNYSILHSLALSSNLHAPLQTHVHHFTSCTTFETCVSLHNYVQPLCAASMTTKSHVLHQAASGCVAWRAADGSAHHH